MFAAAAPENGAFVAALSESAGVSNRILVPNVPSGSRRTVEPHNILESAALVENYLYCADGRKGDSPKERAMFTKKAHYLAGIDGRGLREYVFSLS